MAYEYRSLPNNGPPQWHSNRRRRFGFLLMAISALVLLWVGFKLALPRTPFSFQKNYQSLGPPPLVDGSSPSADPKKTAVVSTLYTDSYVFGAAVLGHSIRRHNVTSRLILPYLEGRISNEALCIARVVGWEPMVVPHIPPPHNGEGIYYRFADQYTKLNIWGLDKLGIEKAVYLDSDTLVRRNFNELFDLPYNFAAVPDVYGDKRGFTIDFNAGVLAFKPSSQVLENMKKMLDVAVYPLNQAEQSFLNLYFAANALRLPYAYNSNLAIKKVSPSLWEGMKDEMRVVHYTLIKPFVEEHGEQSSDAVKIPNEDGLRKILRQAAEQDDGFFAEEMSWWQTAYDELMAEFRGEIEDCLRR